MLETRFAFTPDGKLSLSGPGSRVESTGTAAEVVAPAPFTREVVTSGDGNLSLQPIVRSNITTQRPKW